MKPFAAIVVIAILLALVLRRRRDVTPRVDRDAWPEDVGWTW